MVNKRGRQKKCVKIFLNFTNLHKTQPGQKTAGIFPNFFEDIYAPYVWVSRFGCRFKYLTVWWRYSPGGGTSLWVRRGCAPVLGSFWPENSGIGVSFYWKISVIGVYFHSEFSGIGGYSKFCNGC